MRDHHETSVDELTLDQELDRSLQAFHPDIQTIGRRYLPATTLHGELLVRIYDVLSVREGTTSAGVTTESVDAATESVNAATESVDAATVDAAVGVELFRAYGLTRELPADETRRIGPETGPSSASILAGDQFLSTSFDRIGHESTSIRRAALGIETASTAVGRFCAIRSDDAGGNSDDGRARGNNSGNGGVVADAFARLDIERDASGAVDLVTPALTGVFAVDLAAVLARGSLSAPEPVRAAGASIGEAIACRRLKRGSDSRCTRWTARRSRDGSNPHRTRDGAPDFDRLVTEYLADARRALETASLPGSEPFGNYLDRIESITSEPV